MRLYGLPWTLPPRLGIEDSYFLVHFLSHPVSTYHGLLNSQLSTVLDAVIGKLWFLSPWGFLSWVTAVTYVITFMLVAVGAQRRKE